MTKQGDMPIDAAGLNHGGRSHLLDLPIEQFLMQACCGSRS